MNAKPLLILTVVTVLLALGGYALDPSRGAGPGLERAGDRLFAGLDSQLEELDRLVVEGADGATTLEKRDGTWVVTDREGYPCDPDQIGRVLKGLATAEYFEPKTGKEENYEQLGLQGPDAEESPTVRVTAKAGGDVRADLFIGNRQYRGVGTQEAWFARQVDETTCWKVIGKLRVPTAPTAWLEKLLSYEPERLLAVSVTHADGEVVELSRRSARESGFELVNLPEGRETLTPRSGATFESALKDFRFDDVVKADPATPEPTPDTVTSFTLDSGLILRFDLWIERSDSDTVSEIRARITPGIDEARAPAAEGPGVAAEDEEARPPSPRQLLEQEVLRIASKTGGWIYTLSPWTERSFTVSMEDLLKELPEETMEEAVEESSIPKKAPGLEEETESEEGASEGDDTGSDSETEDAGANQDESDSGDDSSDG